MKKQLLAAISLLTLTAQAQVKVGDNPTSVNSSAVLETESTTKGFLPPRMTKVQMDAIANPAEGLTIYCTDCSPKGLYVNNSSPTPNWVSTASGGSSMALDCASQYRVGIAASNWNITQGDTIFVPYSYNALGSGSVTLSPISSTGITGLTATAIPNPVTISAGTGVLKFSITGTPGSTGTASFPLTVLGSNCTMTYPVVSGATVSALDCSGGTISRYVGTGFSVSGTTITIPYSGGNGGSYPAHTVASTGVTGLTASIGAGTIANGSGSMVYTLSGTPSGAGTATFNFNIGGQTCSFSTTVYSGVLSTITNAGAPAVNYYIKFDNASYWLYMPSSGLRVLLTNTTSGTDRYWNVINTGAGQYAVYNPARGVMMGNYNNDFGNGGYLDAWGSNSGSASNVNQRFLLQAVSGSVFGGGTIALKPASASGQGVDVPSCAASPGAGLQYYNYNGNSCQIYRLQASQTLTGGVAAPSNYYVSIGYFGGNGGTYPAISAASTGVTGLTATASAGSMANGVLGALTFTISGTPSGSGTATFPVFIGGQSFSFSLTVQ